MIQQLQRRFVASAMLSLVIVLLLVLAVVNGINMNNLNHRYDSVIDMLAENRGQFPEEMEEHEKPEKDEKPDKNISEETPFETRYFIVKADSSKEITDINTGHIAAVSSDAAVAYAREAMNGSAERGYEDNYRYRVVLNPDGTYLLVFVDARMAVNTAQDFLLNSILVAMVSLGSLFVMVMLLSRRAVRPFVENVERQKRFITDAAHELRTPLAIIASDNDVIEMTIEKSEWTESIRNQIHRMDNLIKDLIIMSRMEEMQNNLGFAPVNLSRITGEELQDFHVLAEQRRIRVETDLQPDVACMGDEKNLKRVVEILMDNAFKYVNEGGAILLSLKSDGKKVHFAIENTCEEVPKGDLRRLFDRFYRADKARMHETGKKGGYGIGLSMADAIVRQHHGKIRAERVQQDRIRFSIELPA